jgi:CO dehydrogenase/acetyl-CoA synthase beta subunit
VTVFDVYIQKVAEYVEAMRARGREIRTFQAPLSSVRHGKRLPIRVGPGANPGIILRDDTSVELGNPEAGSSAFLLLTDSPSLLKDGRITLIGPDIKESAGKSLPFGQVLMVGGTSLADKDLEALQHDQIIGDQIEGYMARSMTRNIWSRVSKEAAGKGFSFEMLGQALMAICRSGQTRIQAVEAVFVTSGKNDLKPLNDLAEQVQKIGREVVRENWKIKGYDIDCLSDCGNCKDKSVCDDIKEVLLEKKNKLIA